MTTPHSAYQDPGIEVIRDLMKAKQIKSKDEDGILAMAHAQSHRLMGGSASDAFTFDPDSPNYYREQAIKKALDAVNIDDLSGKSPLQKAMSFMHLVDKNLGNMEDALKQGNAETVAQQMKEISKTQQLLKKPGGDKGGTGGDGATPEEEFHKLSKKERDVFLAYKSISHLPGLNFAAVKILKPKEDGPVEKDVEVETLSEALRAASGGDMVSPMFMTRVLNRDFDKQDNQDYITVMQTILLCIDDSGSMGSSGKQAYVQAILQFLQELIDKNQIVLFIGTFEDTLVNIEHVTDTMDYYKRNIKTSWGNTEVNDVITQSFELIESGEIAGVKLDKRSRPQLVIINDGQDYVDATMRPPYPIHAISLEVENPYFKNLCNKSGGSFKMMQSMDYDRRAARQQFVNRRYANMNTKPTPTVFTKALKQLSK